MKIILHNNNILCKLIAREEKKTESGFVYHVPEVNLYEVVSTPVNYEGMVKTGDIVTVNSTGTLVEVNGVDYLLFKDENITAKIMN